jgi:hypothetical protein
VIAGSEVDFQRKLYQNKMQPATGPTFSLFLKKNVTHRLYLKFEAAYSRKGNFSPNSALWNLNIEYFSAYMRLGVPFNLTRRLQLGIEVGPALNFQRGRETDQLATAYAIVKPTLNRITLSALGGGNVEYRITERRHVFFNCTRYGDLVPIFSYKNGNATYRVNNQGWLFMVGLMNRLGNYNSKF